jgi:prepilin-type N-terminal cleavage/methylation domain-containing protein
MSLRRTRESGFTMVELIIVVAVVLAVTAMATPKVLQMIYNVRLRSSAYELSGLMQAARTQAIRDNKYLYLCYKVIQNRTRAWVAADNTCSAPGANDQQVQMGGNVTITTSGAPSGLNSTLLSFSPPTGVLVTAKPAFNSRGLPCYLSSGRCSSIYAGAFSSQTVSYILYLTDSRPVGANGWAAVAISPAGRMQVWSYRGNSWGR